MPFPLVITRLVSQNEIPSPSTTMLISTVLDLGGSAAPLDPKETIPVLLKFIVASASEHSGKSWDYWGDKVQEYEW